MRKIAFVFPGQGSQAVGMGKDIYEKYPEARRIYDAADEILGISLTGLCFDGPEEELRLTSNLQPALFTTSVACLKVIESGGRKPAVAAGHSIGEYAALVAAGAAEFEDALPLVRKRGLLMQQAGKEKPGTMAAVIGLDPEKVREACKKAESAGIVDVANYNSPGQIVISGEVGAVAAASEYASRMGAKKVMPLNVSGAFHSRLMKEAAEVLTADLEKTPFKDTAVPVVANVTAGYVKTAGEIKKALAQQIAGSVRWEESVVKMVEDGVELFVEIGPGKVLSGLVKRTTPSAETLTAGDAAAIEEFHNNYPG